MTENNTPYIHIANLVKTFNKIKVLDSLNADIFPGDRIALIGQNGAGKTTLIRCILGQYLFEGDLTVFDLTPRMNREKILKYIGFVPQIPPPIRLTVGELINFIGHLSQTETNTFYRYSGELGLDIKEHLSKPFYKLSGGMKQKILISLALGRNPKILIMDEPSANLDPEARKIFFEFLENMNGETTMLLSSHRIGEISSLINRVIEMDLGKIITDEHVSLGENTGEIFEYSILLNDDTENEDLLNLLREYNFTRKEGRLTGEVSGTDNLLFMQSVSRFSGIIQKMQVNKKEN
jgi:ABC-2 type transport system ATP-binding protein